ncbi:MAG: hypothetical protein LUG18_07550 [Candidatus Azobacteroides sp.]|nr:hypothetical protein [Candidatus Azobacteroides sp.]
MSKKKKKKKKLTATLGEILGGDVLERNLLSKHLALILWIVFLIFVYMSYGYNAFSQLKEIETLQKDLIRVKNESLNQSVELVEKSRRTNINHLIDTRRLDLKESQAPVYVITEEPEKK